MRVAIVGGGAAGLSAALHLAPLASAGIIASPVDVFESKSLDDVHPHCDPDYASKYNTGDGSNQDKYLHTGSGALGRPIGVGLWSTALLPLLDSGRNSHAFLLDELERVGKYVGAVGYRTPNGKWLARSELNTRRNIEEKDATRGETEDDSVPGLLFLREKDMLRAMREAAYLESSQFGTIKIHYGEKGSATQNDGGGSTTVVGTEMTRGGDGHSCRLVFSDGAISPIDTQYHLIIAADGMHSSLRAKYGGRSIQRHEVSDARRDESGKPSNLGITGTAGMSDSSRLGTEDSRGLAEQRRIWAELEQSEMSKIEDRNYTVFRGNAHMTNAEAKMEDVSFQTWGEGNGMRFAAVGMAHPPDKERRDDMTQNKVEKQVWFATTSDPELSKPSDPEKRKNLLLRDFQSWHDPVARLIEATPAGSILMERGVAHRYSSRPVFNMAEIIEYEHKHKGRGMDSASGPGPVLMFIGDASMTVDPVLAQGFTFAMESAADLARTLRRVCDDTKKESKLKGGVYGPILPTFDPDRLRAELYDRHIRRYSRLMCLLRSTDLVQALAQPESGTVGGFLSRYLVRPAMRLAPDFVKSLVFNAMIRYSLGLTIKGNDEIEKDGNR